MSLPLPPRSCMEQPLIPYRKPKLLATYSHQPDRTIRHDNSSMPFYRGAPTGSDLYYGFEDRVERDETVAEHLDGLCAALRMQAEQGRRWKNGGLVTWRGMATRLMAAPFEERDGWEMTATAIGGSVYLEVYDPPKERRRRLEEQKSYAKQSYVGYSFESYSTGEQMEGPPGWSGAVNTNIQWCCVVESAIGDLPVILGGEVDCVTNEAKLEDTIELKTNMMIMNARHDATFQKKLLKHWAQSYLLGVPQVEVGFRDNAGILHSLHRFQTTQIPRLVSRTSPWHPNPALANLHAVVNFLTSTILPTDPHPAGTPPLPPSDPLPNSTTWRLAFQPAKGFTLRQVEPETFDARWGDILREDFVRWVLSHGEWRGDAVDKEYLHRIALDHSSSTFTMADPNAPSGNVTAAASDDIVPDTCDSLANGGQCFNDLQALPAWKIGVIVASIVVGLLLLAFLWNLWKRRSKRKHEMEVAKVHGSSKPTV